MADKKKPVVIGQFTGKCCDSNVVNNNDMHLGRQLFENLFASDEYKTALANGHYIGFLGHPDDPGDQNYMNACIVMTDCYLTDDGEVFGTFDLVDTPVGRTVKSFIDAGVNFGISIRGAGDVASDGEVDPDTFVFRGFDLVTFPAYEDCIPEFREIAASKDLEKQKKFKKVCASVNKELNNITSCEALKVLQEQFGEGTDEFNKIGARIDEITSDDDDAVASAVLEEKVDALTSMYIDAVNEKNALVQQLADAQVACNVLEVQCSRKIASYKRIVASQMSDIKKDKAQAIRKARITAAESARRIDELEERLNSTAIKLRESKVQASKSADEVNSLKGQLTSVKNQLNSVSSRLEENNLKYKQKIQSSSDLITQHESEIQDLKSQLSETVTASKRLKQQTSNLDAERADLTSRVEAAEKLVLEYQQAYADIYANALGIHLDNLSVTASTSVQDLRDMISAGTSTSNMMSGVMVDDILDDDSEQLESIGDEDDTLITT